jgi:molybdopterin synthase sulfur carrier subunit
MDDSDLHQGLAVEEHQQSAVQVLYFARLKEALGRAAERLAPPPGVDTVAALRAHLQARGGSWASELAPGKPVRVAVNQNMATDETRIQAGDEVAFFPPVTGG